MNLYDTSKSYCSILTIRSAVQRSSYIHDDNTRLLFWPQPCRKFCIQQNGDVTREHNVSNPIYESIISMVWWTAFLTTVNLKLWRLFISTVTTINVYWLITFTPHPKMYSARAFTTNWAFTNMLKSRWVPEPFWSYHRLTSSLNKKERTWKMALLLLHTFAFSYLPRGFWATISVLLLTKPLK